MTDYHDKLFEHAIEETIGRTTPPPMDTNALRRAAAKAPQPMDESANSAHDLAAPRRSVWRQRSGALAAAACFIVGLVLIAQPGGRTTTNEGSTPGDSANTGNSGGERHATNDAARDGTPVDKPERRSLDGAPVANNAAEIESLPRDTRELRGIGLDNAALSAVAALTQLEALELCDCSRVTDVGIVYLANLRSIKELYLGANVGAVSDTIHPNTGITDSGMIQVAALGQLAVLDLVWLDGITDTGLGNLGASRTLRDIGLMRCHRVTKQGVDMLRAAMPECHIRRVTRWDFDGRIERIHLLHRGNVDEYRGSHRYGFYVVTSLTYASNVRGGQRFEIMRNDANGERLIAVVEVVASELLGTENPERPEYPYPDPPAENRVVCRVLYFFQLPGAAAIGPRGGDYLQSVLWEMPEGASQGRFLNVAIAGADSTNPLHGHHRYSNRLCYFATGDELIQSLRDSGVNVQRDIDEQTDLVVEGVDADFDVRVLGLRRDAMIAREFNNKSTYAPEIVNALDVRLYGDPLCAERRLDSDGWSVIDDTIYAPDCVERLPDDTEWLRCRNINDETLRKLLTDVGGQSPISMARFPSLAHFDLSDCKELSAGTIAEVIAAHRNLRTLRMRACAVNEDVMRAIAAPRGPASCLEDIDLSSTPITDADLAALAKEIAISRKDHPGHNKWLALGGLEQMRLDGCAKVTSAGLAALCTMLPAACNVTLPEGRVQPASKVVELNPAAAPAAVSTVPAPWTAEEVKAFIKPGMHWTRHVVKQAVHDGGGRYHNTRIHSKVVSVSDTGYVVEERTSTKPRSLEQSPEKPAYSDEGWSTWSEAVARAIAFDRYGPYFSQFNPGEVEIANETLPAGARAWPCKRYRQGAFTVWYSIDNPGVIVASSGQTTGDLHERLTEWNFTGTDDKPQGARAPMFFGVPVPEKTVFVLGCSAAMADQDDNGRSRWDRVTKELGRTLDMLAVKQEAEFALVTCGGRWNTPSLPRSEDIGEMFLATYRSFTERSDKIETTVTNVLSCSRGLVLATSSNVQEAKRHLEMLAPGTRSNLNPAHEALRLACQMYGDEVGVIIYVDAALPAYVTAGLPGEDSVERGESSTPTAETVVAAFPNWFSPLHINGCIFTCIQLGDDQALGSFMKKLADTAAGTLIKLD